MRHVLDGVVRQLVETVLDTSSGNHRVNLADSLRDHHRDVRLRVHAGDQKKITVDRGTAFRHQSVSERDLHAASVRDAKLAAGRSGYSGRLVYNHLDDSCHLVALQMGCGGSGAILGLGQYCDSAAIEHDVDELGKVIT
ncbi:MAG: hypothetical protein ACI9HK_003060 [Pirellulaceae bacterium]